jgi:1D-myo-inositol-triphosphate 3-kinase
MQNLLHQYSKPNVMDIKIGTSTCLSDEAMNNVPRYDLYMRLFNTCPESLTENENDHRLITKKRYMSWRDQMTSSRSLGFRIEAINVN